MRSCELEVLRSDDRSPHQSPQWWEKTSAPRARATDYASPQTTERTSNANVEGSLMWSVSYFYEMFCFDSSRKNGCTKKLGWTKTFTVTGVTMSLLNARSGSLTFEAMLNTDSNHLVHHYSNHSNQPRCNSSVPLRKLSKALTVNTWSLFSPDSFSSPSYVFRWLWMSQIAALKML